MEDRMYDHSGGETENPMGDKWKGLERIEREAFDAVHDQHATGKTLEEVLRDEFGPLLDAADKATGDDCPCPKCVMIRKQLEKFK